MSTDDFARSVNILQPHSDSPTNCAAPCEVSAPLHLSPEGRGRIAPWRDPGEGGPEYVPNPGQAPSPGMAASAAIPTSPRWGEVERAARPIPTSQPGPSRREFLATAAAATGALVVGFWMPQRAAAGENPPGVTPATATWATDPAVDEVNAWVVVAPDDNVTIRIAQTELGQGVWTSNAMMVAEELQCDWSKVRPEYASANRDGREMAPDWTLHVPGKGATDPLGGGEPQFGERNRRGITGIPDTLYRRMRTNAAASVRDGRYYLQLAGAEARERLLLAAASTWGVPVGQVKSANGVITHVPTGRTVTYGQMAALAAKTPHPHPEQIRIKPPAEWTLMGTEQRNLDVPLKVTGKTIYGIDVKLPGMKWAAVRSCPVYGGTVKSYDFAAVRNEPGVISALKFPIPEPGLIRERTFSGGVAVIADHWYQAKAALDKMPIEWDVPPQNAARNSANMRATLIAALDQPGKVRVDQGDCDHAFASGARNRGGDLHHALSAARPHGARQRHRARHRRPGGHLDRRPEPAGDALLRRQNHRHSGSQRLSAPLPPRRRLRPQRQRPAGRTGDLHRQPAPRHAHSPAVDARGGFHRLHLPGHGRRPPARRARCRRLPRSARSAHRHGRDRPRGECVLRPGLGLLCAELPVLQPLRELPRAGRHAARRRYPGARFLPRELFGRTRPRYGPGPLPLPPRADRAHKPSLQGRHAQGARHRSRDGRLGHAAAPKGWRGRSRWRSAAPRAAATPPSPPWCTRCRSARRARCDCCASISPTRKVSASSIRSR